jgi:hypothetical protein
METCNLPGVVQPMCGIKYIGQEYLQHLYDALQKETYEIVEDWAGDLYCGITLKWNYKKHHVDLAMPA